MNHWMVAGLLVLSTVALSGSAAAEQVTGCVTGAGACFAEDHLPRCVQEGPFCFVHDPTDSLPNCVVEGPLCS